jgi:hypothetical protein
MRAISNWHRARKYALFFRLLHSDNKVLRKLDHHFYVIPTATVNAGRPWSVRTPPNEDSQNCSRGTRAVEKLTQCRIRIGTISNIGPRITSP